jgi:cysteine-rich repeat protein
MREHSMTRLLFVLLLLGCPSCSLVVDGTLAGRDGGTDMDAPTSGCAVAVDGTQCAVEGLLDNRICIAGNCVPASCGDGFVETRDDQELCDDGNGTAGDGCDGDCTFSCEAAADCDDGELCNGDELCDTAMHVCAAGMDAADGTTCMVEGIAATCRSGVCRAGVCPNGTPEPGEDCDDGNMTDGDGCDADCTFTCTTDADCQDGDACNGAETCDTATHLCSGGMTLDCNDMDECTTDTCAAATGCVNTSVFVDGDGDGFTAAMAGAPASCVSVDCNDGDPSTYPGAPEPCGGTVDLNCDGSTAAPTWYADCDGDGYALASATSMMACSAPTTRPSTCASGTPGLWTSRRPSGSTSIDCADRDAAARPGQLAYYGVPVVGVGGYDFNCDGFTSREFSVGRPRDFVECSGGGRLCSGTAYWAETSVNCGAQVTPYPDLSHCSGTTLCLRVLTPTSSVRCR